MLDIIQSRGLVEVMKELTINSRPYVARGGGGSQGSEEPPPPQTKKGPPKGLQKAPLQCIRTKRSSITVCLINDAAYYTDIDLDTVEDLNQFCYPIT